MKLLLIVLNIFFVSFTDKPTVSQPALSERAMTQREKWQIELDEMDYPVDATYLDSLVSKGAKVMHTSRWMNGATVEMSDSIANMVAEWNFVADIEITRDNSSPRAFAPALKCPNQVQDMEIEPTIAQTDKQLNLYNLLPLHREGFEGQGIVMAVCDGGFYKADTLSCFRQSELELGHYDFTDDTDDFYGATGNHGTMCLSAISGKTIGFTGAATKAQYYLMRSEEYSTESRKEMDNLVAALEKADSLGVNVFSVSLGYYMFDNISWDITHEALDGVTSRVSRAATIAARKGMLVCVAAGNEGNTPWQKICLPADADSILTVGAVDEKGVIADFSGYGPSADGRIKPEVCAVGAQTVLLSPKGKIVRSNGTSFAAPLIAGMAASLWSALPDENAMQIRDRILRSADRYNDPDPIRYGYGIPDAWKAYTMQTEGCSVPKESTKNEVRKVIRGTEMFIIRHGHVYNLAGQLVQ